MSNAEIDTDHRLVRADALAPGDMVDLEGDRYAACPDPDCSCTLNDEFEYRVVWLVNDPDAPEWAKAPEGGTLISFEDDSAIAFPSDHLLRVAI